MKLYVGKLDYTIDHDHLEEMFSEFGEIESAKVVTDDEGRSKGFGFVVFKNKKDGDKAIKEMSGKKHMGLNLIVDESKS